MSDDSRFLETHLDSARHFSGRLINLRVDTVRLPDGREARREVVEHPGAVALVALTADGGVLLVRQWRYPAGRVSIELPAGTVELPQAEAPDAVLGLPAVVDAGVVPDLPREMPEIETPDVTVEPPQVEAPDMAAGALDLAVEPPAAGVADVAVTVPETPKLSWTTIVSDCGPVSDGQRKTARVVLSRSTLGGALGERRKSHHS